MKIKGSKLKFYLKILNLFLIINMIIGCFPRSLTIADAVINSDVANTRKASDTNADYLASATVYNYYSNYNLNSNYNNSINHNDEYYDKQHYSFETFNRKISDYAKRIICFIHYILEISGERQVTTLMEQFQMNNLDNRYL